MRNSALKADRSIHRTKIREGLQQVLRSCLCSAFLKRCEKRGKEEVKYHSDFKISEQYKGMGEGRKFYIRTYGCQMNEHDTEVMAGIFMTLGYEPTDSTEDANVILLNTCAIRENAENKVFGEIGHLKALKKTIRI